MQVFNRLLATVVATAVLLGGLLAAVDIVLVQAGRPAVLVPVAGWAAWFRVQSFGAGIIRLVCAGLIVVGVVLLVAGLRRGRPGALRLPARTAGVTVTAARRGLERSVAGAVERVDGVSSASARARRRSIRVSVRTGVREPGELAGRVGAAVGEQLEQVGLAGTLRPRVKVRSTATHPHTATGTGTGTGTGIHASAGGVR